MLFADPVRFISMERTAPWDLLPIVDALSDLAPFGIFDAGEEHLLDPEDCRPRCPAPAPPPFALSALPEGGSGSSLLRLRWQALTDQYLWAPFFFQRGDRLIVPVANGVTVLEAGSGRTIWTREVGRTMSVTAAGECVVLAGRHPRAFGFSVADGSLLWDLEIGGEAYSSGTLLASGEVALPVHQENRLGEVLVLRPESGEPVWRASFQDSLTMRVQSAGEWLLVAAGSAVELLDARTGKVLGSRVFQPRPVNERTVMVPPAAEMLARGGSGLFLGPRDLVKLSLPFLDGPVVLAEFPEHTGFERFLGRVSEDLALVGFPLDRERGVLRAIELSSFRTRYEIDIDATPSPPASINHEVWATVLRPLRQHSGREASLLLVETATGRVIGREPLGCTGWYEGHVQGGEGSVFVTVRTGPGNHSVRAYDRGVG